MLSMAAIAARRPMAFASFVACVKMTSADLFTQRFLEERREVDAKRTMTFAAFGVVQIGVIQYTIFCRVLPALFPYTSVFAAKSLAEKAYDIRGLLSVCGMTLFHECVVTPFEIFPAFYISKELFQGSGEGSAAEHATRVLSNWSRNFFEDNLRSIMIFGPTNLINFCFMPVYLRTPFATAAGTVWAVLLSVSRGAGSHHRGSLKEEAINSKGYKELDREVDRLRSLSQRLIFVD